jgi:hypothetical protein
MRSFSLFLLLGLGALGLVMETPSLAEAGPWRGGFRGGWRGGFYGGRWGRAYGYRGWGWGGYYGYPAYWGWGGYGYPAYYYPGYGYPSYSYSYPTDDVGVPSVSGTSISLYGNSAAPSPEDKAVSKLLTASGVPNDQGRIRWPLGLQVVGGPDSGHEVDELREQIGELFQEAAKQAANGPANPKLLPEITRAVKRLRRLLIRDREERFALSADTYDEAERFLNQLDDAEAVLRTGFKTQGAESHR